MPNLGTWSGARRSDLRRRVFADLGAPGSMAKQSFAALLRDGFALTAAPAVSSGSCRFCSVTWVTVRRDTSTRLVCACTSTQGKSMSATRLMIYGAPAGAAGTTALDGLTYVDMAVRGRASSSSPEKTVEELSEVASVPIPGDEEARENRVSGLGPLSGLLAGVGIGALLSATRAAGWRPRLPVSMVAATLGAMVGAMVGTSGPMTVLGVTDPRTWTAKSWVVDIVPHLAYGAVTAAVLGRLDGD